MLKKSNYRLVTKNANTTILGMADLSTETISSSVADKFLRTLEEKSDILPYVRKIPMKDYQTTVNSLFLDEDVVYAKNDTDGEGVTFDTTPTTLTVNKLEAVLIFDDDLKDFNIEGEEIEGTFVDELSIVSSNNISRIALFGDKNITANATDGGTKKRQVSYRAADGFIKKAGKKIAVAAGADGVLDVLETMITALGEVSGIENYQFWVDYSTYRAIKAELRKRQTELGDRAVVGANSLTYDNFPIFKKDSLSGYLSVDNGGTGKVIMLVRPDNLLYGEYRELGLIIDHDVRAENTMVKAKFAGDFNHSTATLSVVGFFDKAQEDLA